MVDLQFTNMDFTELKPFSGDKKILPYLFRKKLRGVTTRCNFKPNGDDDQKTSTHEPGKKPPTFHCIGWLIGVLIMAYYNPYIWLGSLASAIYPKQRGAPSSLLT